MFFSALQRFVGAVSSSQELLKLHGNVLGTCHIGGVAGKEMKGKLLFAAWSEVLQNTCKSSLVPPK